MVDLKLSLYTKTWTWMNWMAILLFSIFIYFGFVLFGDMLTFFNSYKTAMITFKSWHFLLAVIFFTITVYIIDMSFLIANKEICTSLTTFFRSIMRRGKEKDPDIFNKVVKVFRNKQKEEEIKKEAERETSRNLNE